MYLFVYGTLRKHGSNHQVIQNEELVASQAWSKGNLYDPEKGFPYFINKGPKRVYGEVYKISNEKLLEIKDLNYGNTKAETFYQPSTISVMTDLLGEIECVTFINSEEQAVGLFPLTYGDWLVHLEIEKDNHTYFAYGSCMDNERFKLADVDHLFTNKIGGGLTDRLEMNYSLSVHDGGRANLIETGKQGEGVLYKVNKEAVEYLFMREGVYNGTYRPAMIDVMVDGRLYEKSLTFIVLDPVKECAPPLHYATEIIRGSKGTVSPEYHSKLVNDLKTKFNLSVGET
ncbi:gamma-glutamylcyclotransferase [Jeotgalibacillus proteolyticus]|uniref:gamma-glutamylcyclotransferase n=1 Tax=Jeotgalibacillus proteolyticus TaxID=2082395 RepID=UPI003CE89B38